MKASVEQGKNTPVPKDDEEDETQDSAQDETQEDEAPKHADGKTVRKADADEETQFH